MEEFGHFANATLLHETRLFIIATLTKGKVIGNRGGTMKIIINNTKATIQTKSYFKYSNKIN